MKNPAEVARGYLTLGKIKTEQTAVRLLLLGMLAGAFIALAGAAATFGNVYVGKVAGAAIFPAGLTMVVLAGSDCSQATGLLIIPLLERRSACGRCCAAGRSSTSGTSSARCSSPGCAARRGRSTSCAMPLSRQRR